MSATETSARLSPLRWIANQPYLLLSITALCWAGNAVVGKLAAGHIPPVTLSFLRWFFAFLIVLPLSWKYLVQDWNAIRGRLGVMVVLSVTGIGAFNTMQYWSLEHTQAINTLLLQPAAPLFVAMWSLALFGTRLTAAQAIGILLSLTGVLVIMLRGDLTSLKDIDFNRGDLIFVLALLIFGLYSVLTAKRPTIHPLSFVAFTFGCGAACLIPFFVFEMYARPVMELNGANLLTLFYVAVFPSTLAYLCFNRGVELVGAGRAGLFIHLLPVFGSILAVIFLGERIETFHLIGAGLIAGGLVIASRR